MIGNPHKSTNPSFLTSKMGLQRFTLSCIMLACSILCTSFSISNFQWCGYLYERTFTQLKPGWGTISWSWALVGDRSRGSKKTSAYSAKRRAIRPRISDCWYCWSEETKLQNSNFSFLLIALSIAFKEKETACLGYLVKSLAHSPN